MTEWNLEVEHSYVAKYTVEAETLDEAEDLANNLFLDDLWDNCASSTSKFKETISIEEEV